MSNLGKLFFYSPLNKGKLNLKSKKDRFVYNDLIFFGQFGWQKLARSSRPIKVFHSSVSSWLKSFVGWVPENVVFLLSIKSQICLNQGPRQGFTDRKVGPRGPRDPRRTGPDAGQGYFLNGGPTRSPWRFVDPWSLEPRYIGQRIYSSVQCFNTNLV